MFDEYVAAGWSLCSIDKGQKGPLYKQWNEPEKAAEVNAAAAGLDGAGLLHALSGTCALDIDVMDKAKIWLAERDVNVESLMADPNAVMISSGRQGRAKLLYKLSRPLRTLKPEGSGLELRCATAEGKSVQDVLPPSIHPLTKRPYVWKYGEPLIGHWSTLPAIPAALLACWRAHATEISNVERSDSTQDHPIDVVRKAILNFIKSRGKDVTSYDDWLEVGQRLHDQTHGAEEGLAVWDEWSQTDSSTAGDGSPRYQGYASLKAKWLSFNSGGGKRVVGMERLIAELPAEADEFPIETHEPTADTTQALIDQIEVTSRKGAQQKLEAKLIYVKSAEKYFDVDEHRIIGSEAAIRHLYSHMMPKTKSGRVDPVSTLECSATKTVVDMLAFHPGKGVRFQFNGDELANGYRNRLPAPVEPMADELEKIEWLFNRIDDPMYRKWLLQFYAYVVQHPGVKIKSAPLIWSETEGNGKSTLVKAIPELLVGREYSKEINASLLGSDFNDYLLNAWHVNLAEFRAGTRGEREAISKKVENWIADPTVAIHPKGLRGYSMPNHFFVTASSNADDAAAITNANRKWAIHELHAPQMTELEQQWIYPEFLMQERAAAVLRHYFLNISTLGFSPSAKAPETAARAAMVATSSSPDIELLTTAWEERSGPFARDVVLVRDVHELTQKCAARPSMQRVSKLLSKRPFNGISKVFGIGERTFRAVILRNADRWANAFGRDVMAHIEGEDSELSDEKDVDLLA